MPPAQELHQGFQLVGRPGERRHERLGPLQLRDIETLLVEGPGAGQLRQTVDPVIGMANAALEPEHLGPCLELVVGVNKPVAERIRIVRDRSDHPQPVELVLAERVGVKDLADRIRLADPSRTPSRTNSPPAVAANASAHKSMAVKPLMAGPRYQNTPKA